MTAFGPPGRSGADRSGELVTTVKTWTREAFRLSDDTGVFIAELHCDEEGCPPVETVIALLRPEGREEHRLHLPLERISPAHLWQLAAGDHGCCR